MPTQVSAEVVVPRSIRVLVTSDNPGMTARVRSLLQRSRGVQVCDAHDPGTAVAEIAGGKFDVAVVDHTLWCARLGPAATLSRARRWSQETSIVVIGGDCPAEGCQPSPDGAVLVVPADGRALAGAVEQASSAAKARRRRETMMRWLEREATTDPATGLHRRDVFDDELRAACAANETPTGLILVRVVGTGTVSHNYGRQAADRMIQQAAVGFSRMVSASDFAARVGAATFGVILRDTDIDVCRRVARRISQELERANAAEWRDEIPISVVLGVACGTGCSSRELFDMARAQLGGQREPIPAFGFSRRGSGDDPSVA